MAKFKCNDPNCGHRFEGDPYTTTQCPQCGSTDIEEVKGGLSPKAKRIIAAIVIAIIIILLLLKCCDSKDNSITVDIKTTEDIIELSLVMKNGDAVDNGTYVIRVFDEEGEPVIIDDSIVKNGKVILDKAFFDNMGEELTFNFDVVMKDGDKCKVKFSNGNTYITPHKPKKPQVTVKTSYDYSTNTYDIVCTVDADELENLYLMHYNGTNVTIDKTQKDSTFSSIKPSDIVYYVCAKDANGLCSDTHYVGKLVLKQRRIVDEKAIQGILNRVAKKDLKPGDAFDEILGVGEMNIPLTSAIDGNKTLEDALNYAYSSKRTYTFVKSKSVIKTDDGSSKLVKIALK